jgi:Leucine-rich repeat (LRR) protein
LVKKLLWLLGEFHDQTRTPAEETLLVASFSQLLFNVTQPNYAQMIPSAAGTSTDAPQKRDKLFGVVSNDSAVAQVGKRELLISSIVQSLMESASTLSDKLVEPALPKLLEDEEIIHRVYRTRIDSIVAEATVFLTAYRLIIQLHLQEEISIPIMTIRTAEMIAASKKKRSRTIMVTTKDYHSFQLEFEAPLYAIMFWDVLVSVLAPKAALKTFAFKWKPYYPLAASQGWGMYDPADEFERQGLIPPGTTSTNDKANGGGLYRISKINASYDVPSYPSQWLVPQATEDAELRRLLPSRLRQRIPIVSWGRPGGGVLLRCDEPDLASLPDSKDAKSLSKTSADLKLMDTLAAPCSKKAIIDVGGARTYRYAFAGSDWKISFLGTSNNRTLSEAYSTFLKEVESSDRRARRNASPPDASSPESQWILTLQKSISTAASISDMMSRENYCVAMTHCPGNDLDFVVTSLAQIMMDGFYRTIDGLAILLEKDWNSYGFDWSRKLGHSTILYLDDADDASGASTSANSIHSTTPDQTPCIDLFIEAIWQLTLQYPMHFEYTETFLLYLVESIYSGRFGTFLLNTEKERDSFAKDKTTSFWAHIHYSIQQNPDDSEFVNFFYDPDTVFAVLEPRYELSSLKLWYSKHLSQREHAEMMSVAALVEAACNTAPVASPRANIASPTSNPVSPSNSVPNVSISSPRSKQDVTQMLVTTTTTSSSRGSKEHLAITNHSSSSSDLFQSSVDGSVSESASVVSISQSASISDLHGSSHLVRTHSSEKISEYDLVNLDLSFRGLKTIPPSVCMEKAASRLQSLNFSGNRLNFFPSDILRLTQLRRLNLSYNPIGDISRDHFFMMGSRMAMLQQLDLSNTNLAYLPDDLSNMRFLRILIMKENYLEELPPYISSLSRLEVLDVRRNRLKSIPKTLFKLHSLRVLSLGDNTISMADELPPTPTAVVPLQDKRQLRHGSSDSIRAKSLSSAAAVVWSFRNLTNLEVLDWRGNSRQAHAELPSAMFSLPAVQALHLEDNALPVLSPEIGKLVTLSYLNVSYNQIQTLPNELTQLVNLKTLDASHNRLAALPARLSSLPLTSLNLNSNRFKDVPPSVLNLPQLISLDLSNNNIRRVPLALVDNLLELNTLLLGDNQITTLDNLPGLGNLVKLKVLGLQGNQFERLPLELMKLDGTLLHLTVDTTPGTSIVFPPRDILLKGTAAILRYLVERAAMGEADSRVNVLAIGDLPVHKNAFLRRMIRTQSSKQKDIAALPPPPTLATGAIGMGSVLANNASQSTLNVSALHNAVSAPPLERYEWTITSGQDKLANMFSDTSANSSKLTDAPGSANMTGSAGQKAQSNSAEVRTIVWEINMDVEMTRAFLHQYFLNDRSFYIITWEISPLKESLYTWIEIVTSRSKKAHFIILALQSGDTAVQKDYAASMDQDLSKRYGNTLYHGFITAPASAKADFKTILTRIEEAILECPLPRESQPASYFSIERMILATSDIIKPPLLSYQYFESVAKSCGIKDMRKLMRHLMSLGLLLHISDSPILDKYLLLDPLWPFTFLSQLSTNSKLTLSPNGLIPHASLLAATKSGDSRAYPEACLPVLCAFQNALGLVFPLVINTPQLATNLGISSSKEEFPCVAVEAYTQPKVSSPEENARTTRAAVLGSVSGSGSATELVLSDSQRIAELFRDQTRVQAPYMSAKVFPTLHSWIPTLCEESKTSVLGRFWPRTLPPNAALRTLQCGRKYVFHTSPSHLFNRLVSRLLSLVKIECLYRSACLIVNASNPYGDTLPALGPSEIIHISLNRPSKTLKVMVRTSYGVSVLTDVYETLDSLMRDMKIAPVSVTLPCSHCLDERWPKPHHFKLEDAEKASVEPNSVLYCQNWRPIASRFIAPEMALCNIALGRHVTLNDIDLVKLIGEGAAAEVFLGELDGEMVAIKRLRVLKARSTGGSSQDIMVGNDTTASKALAEFRREIRFLSKFQHPTIVGLKAIVLEPPCIITEYCEGGNLFEYCHPPSRDRQTGRMPSETPRSGAVGTDPNTISASYPINWPIRLKIALDIAEGMSLLHSHSPSIVHRDLKSPNILLQLKSSRQPRIQPSKSGVVISSGPKTVSRSPSTPVVPSTASNAASTVHVDSHGSSGSLALSSASVPASSLNHALDADGPHGSTPLSSNPSSASISDLAGSAPSRPAMVRRGASSMGLNVSLEDRVNMWTAQDSIAKITDFGLTGIAPAVAGREVDNPVWLAPEVMLRGVEYGEQTDVYSYAVILYELLTGREYFGHMSFMTDIERAVLSGQRPVLPNSPTTNPTPHPGNSRPNKQQLANSAAASTGAIAGTVHKTDSALNSIQSISAPTLKLTPRLSEKEIVTNYPEDLWKVPEMIHLMYHCLAANPDERPTFFEIVETLKYIIMMHPEYSSNISFPPGSDLTMHSTSPVGSAPLDVFPSDAQMVVDLCPETMNIEYMGVGEPVSALHTSADGHVWIGCTTGTMMCYYAPATLMRSASAFNIDDSTSSSSANPARSTPPTSLKDLNESSEGAVSNTSGSPSVPKVHSSPNPASHQGPNTAATLSPMSIQVPSSVTSPEAKAELNPLLVGTYRSHKATVVAIGPYNGNICSIANDKQVSVWSLPRMEARDKPRAPSVANLEPIDDIPTAFHATPVGMNLLGTVSSANLSASSMNLLGISEQLVVTVKSGSLRYHDGTVGKWKERKIGSNISTASSLLRIAHLGHYWVGCDRKIIRLDDSLKPMDAIAVAPAMPSSTANLVLIVTCMVKAGPYVWTGASDGAIRVYNERTGALHRTLNGAHADDINCMLMVGNQVWSCGKDRSILIWNRFTFQLLKEIKKAHNDNIICLALVQNQEVWSGSSDKTIGRWSISSPTRSGLLYARYEDDSIASPRDASSPLVPTGITDSAEQAPNSSELSDTSSNPGFHPSPTVLKKRRRKHPDHQQSDSHEAPDAPLSRGGSSTSVSPSMPLTQHSTSPNTGSPPPKH